MLSLNNTWFESVADNFSCQTREKNDKESKTKKEKEKKNNEESEIGVK